MKRRTSHLADHRDFEAVLNKFYSLAEKGSSQGEFLVIREIDHIVGKGESFVDLMDILARMIAALHSLQPLTDPLRTEFNQRHEANLMRVISMGNDKNTLPKSVEEFLSGCRRTKDVGISSALPSAFEGLGFPNQKMLDVYWQSNSAFLHPLVLISETSRRVVSMEQSFNSDLIVLECFRQIGMPLLIDVPLDLVGNLSSEAYEDVRHSEFGKAMIFAYENVRQLIASILCKGPSSHYGSGNGFAIFASS